MYRYIFVYTHNEKKKNITIILFPFILGYNPTQYFRLYLFLLCTSWKSWLPPNRNYCKNTNLIATILTVT